MAKASLSTQEVAALLNVTETTVKRWADEGRIPCSRTIGGHRKFILSNIIEFASRNGIALRGGTPPDLEDSSMQLLRLGVELHDYEKLAEVLFQESLKADREPLFQFLTFVYEHGISFAEIADYVVRPAFARIGELWSAGQLAIDQEHGASEALIEALIRFAPELHQKPRNGYSAVCASPSTELHEIGLRTIAYTLESEGWRVRYLGHNTPLDSLRSFVRTAAPDLVCLSLTRFDHQDSTIQEIRTLSTELHAKGAKLVLGGNNSGALQMLALGDDCLCSSAQDLIRYTRDTFSLKPGPKTDRSPRSRRDGLG